MGSIGMTAETRSTLTAIAIVLTDKSLDAQELQTELLHVIQALLNDKEQANA